jgi:hypothetical protein
VTLSEGSFLGGFFFVSDVGVLCIFFLLGYDTHICCWSQTVHIGPVEGTRRGHAILPYHGLSDSNLATRNYFSY